jgi:integrase
MASYGLRAGEVVRLRLEDIDWRTAVVRITRWKTGTETRLPLSTAVAKALVAYLRNGRPEGAAAREVFLRARAPYRRLGGGTAICHLLRRRAAEAGVSAPYLGSHVLRHSHATQQVDRGAVAKVVGDILGHAKPASTSVYVRVSTNRLRSIALPVPR